MSSENTPEKQAKTGKSPIVLATAGVLALAAVGGYVFTTQDKSDSPMTVGSVETPGIEDIAPAAGKDKAPEEKPAEEAAAATETPAAAEPAAQIGDIKVGDPVVATVGKEEIKRSDVFALYHNPAGTSASDAIANIVPIGTGSGFEQQDHR